MSNKISIEITHISKLNQVAQMLVVAYSEAKVWAFEGQMGAGKTTLIQEILKVSGIKDLEGSPTYSLVNEYLTPNDRPIYHFDLYRIENEEEALNIGIEEMIYGEGLSIIEWPEIVKDLLPKETIWFNLSILDDGKTRLLSFQL
jgi:tRNA threonylcarbamoyladenosine biosynthesis protein TsaE